jgi:hypothetical protein
VRVTALAGVVLLAAVTLAEPLRLKQVSGWPVGTWGGPLTCGDTDHDSLPEIIWVPHANWQWEIWEYRPVNRYERVFADTLNWPPHGVDLGWFAPWAIGDFDGDSLTDLLGFMVDGDADSFRGVVGVVESPARDSYPSVLRWWHPLAWHVANGPLCYFAGDLDNDRKADLYYWNPNGDTLVITENQANNQYRVVWDSAAPVGWTTAFGDFDLDGHQECVSGSSGSLGEVWMYENTGDDAYTLSWMDTVHVPNGVDAFSGNDLDSDGKPEFYIAFCWHPGTVADFYLYMWEMTGNNTYERTLVANRQCEVGDDFFGLGVCGDVDADGADELLWSTGSDLFIYKATGNNQFTEVWNWHNPTQCEVRTLLPNLYDMNGDGYKELVMSGVFRGTPGYARESTCVFEVEAVQVVEPNGGQTFAPGDTCEVRWRTFSPPRCDSVSLFLRTDTTIVNRFYRLDTIAHGLSPNESTYSWVVPDTTLDSARIVAIAYGPGWQFDESDSTFAILPGGVAETRRVLPRSWSLAVSPNPARGAFSVRYDVPQQCRVSVGIYDACGRLVESLAAGAVAVGRYSVDVPRGALPAGTYFVRLDAAAFSAVKKVVMQ